MQVPLRHPTEVSPTLPLIELGTHWIRVTQLNAAMRSALLDYLRKKLCWMGLVKQGKRFVMAPKKVFAGSTADRRFFHFHRSEFDEICAHLDAYGLNPLRTRSVQVIERELPTPAPLKARYIETKTPRDYQEPQINYVLAPGYQKVIMARPGRGKTYMALRVAAALRVRTLILIKSMYIKKWEKDIQEAFEVDEDTIIKVQGKNDLVKLMIKVEEGSINPDFILLSNMTWFYYLKDYEINPDYMEGLGWPMMPPEMTQRLGVGFKIMDEVHQDFHIGYRSEIYTHGVKSLGLSGTLISDEEFINGRYRVMFPVTDRPPEIDDISHVQVQALHYRIHKVDKRISYINPGMRSYSHTRLEQSVMKKPPIWHAYRDMICDITNRHFIRRRQEGQKMIIYCSTVEMCTVLAKRLQRLHPDMAIQRYVSADDFDEMMEAELIVSTLKSLGTAIDIPKLTMILMTDAIKSIQSNLQAMERLRPLDKWWPGEHPTFMYLVCDDLDKHVEYHTHKRKIFRDKVVSHRDLFTDYHI